LIAGLGSVKANSYHTPGTIGPAAAWLSARSVAIENAINNSLLPKDESQARHRIGLIAGRIQSIRNCTTTRDSNATE
jgi:hypothetical protein